MRTGDRWYKRIVRDSRYNDGRHNRVIDPAIPYIDTEMLVRFQQEQQNRCWYCDVFMNWLERRSNKTGLTLERADNALPHYKTNCRGLCCKSCNSKRYTQDHGLLKRYFTKWKHAVFEIRGNTNGERRASFAS